MDVILLDGGMGQELVQRSKNPAHPQWSAHVMREEPEIVQAVHEDYLRAGATVITLNTYSTTPGRFENFGVPEQFETMYMKAIDLAHGARDAVGTEATIAGCLPPLIGSYQPDLLPADEVLLEEYRTLAGMAADHVDVFICETMSKASEARMAASAGVETGKPVWVAWTLSEELGPDGQPRLRSGETIAEAFVALDGLTVDVVMFNCCPPEVMTAGMGQLAADGRPFGGYGNGFTPIPKGFTLGVTVEALGKRTDLGPAAYADHAMDWVNAGATIVGGCCEVGPAHIAEMAQRLSAAGHCIVARL